MLSWHAATLSTVVIVAIGIGMIWTFRKLLTPRLPVLAIGASIAVVAAVLLFVGECLGVDTSRVFSGVLVVAAFTGAICVDSRPWSPSSLLRALAISAAGIAVVAAAMENHTASALALLATGVLIKVCSDVCSKGLDR